MTADVLTVPEVADALRCSTSNVYERIRVGEIPALRLGRTVRVPARWVADAISAAMAPSDHYAEHMGDAALASDSVTRHGEVRAAGSDGTAAVSTAQRDRTSTDSGGRWIDRETDSSTRAPHAVGGGSRTIRNATTVDSIPTKEVEPTVADQEIIT